MSVYFGNWDILGFVFSDQVFQQKVYPIRFMAQLHAATYGGEFNAGDFCSHGNQPAFNLILVSSTRAEVHVAKGVLSYTEAPQRKVKQVSGVLFP